VRKAEAGSPTRGLRAVKMQGNFRELAGLLSISAQARSIPKLSTCCKAKHLVAAAISHAARTSRNKTQTPRIFQ
jgi:hypothetical protein